MDWNVTEFTSASGRRLVDIEISKLPEKARDKVIHQIDLLERYGPMVGLPHVKLVERDLYELRMLGVDSIRILFCIRGHLIVLLRAFRKKTPKLPQKELRLARSRRAVLR